MLFRISGGVEIKARTAKDKILVPIDQALDKVKALLAGESAR